MPSVPTEVKLELITELPNVVESSTVSMPILYDLPAAKAMCSELVQESEASTQLNVLSVAPLRVIPPPSAVMSVGVVTSASMIFLSSITKLVELRLVVDPLTVRSPFMIVFTR